MTRILPWLLAAPLLAALAGCGSWLGESEDPPLPGERVAVLLLEEGLTVDERLSTLTVTVPPAVRNLDWPQAGGTPSHAPGHLELGRALRLAWQENAGAGTGGRSRLLAAPVVAGGRVFVVDSDGVLSAHDAGAGRRLWRVEPAGRKSADRLGGGTVAAAGDAVFVAYAHGDVIALSAADGAERWQTRIGSPVRASPAVAGEIVLVPTADNQLIALAVDDGEVLWRHAGTFEPAALLGGAAPAVDRGIVVVTYSSGEVYGLELESGRPLWSEVVLRPRRTLAVGSLTDIVGDPVIIDDRVIVAGNSGEMAAFDLSRGARIWDVRLSSQQTPWVAGDFIYVLNDHGELACLLQQGGRVRWTTSLADPGTAGDEDEPPAQWTGPVLAGERLLVVSSRGELVSVSPFTGEILSRETTSGPILLPPVISDATLYLLNEGGTLLAYR